MLGRQVGMLVLPKVESRCALPPAFLTHADRTWLFGPALAAHVNQSNITELLTGEKRDW